MAEETVLFEPGPLEQHVTDVLSCRGAAEAATAAIFDQLLRFGAKPGDESESDTLEYINADRRIAIRTEYLNPLHDLATGASSAGIASLFAKLTSMHLAGIGMLLAGISAWARLSSRVVGLNERQVQVLLTLRAAEQGLTEGDLTRRLSEVFDRASLYRRRKSWDAVTTRKILDSLRQIHDDGGEPQALVTRESQRWKVNGI